MAVGLMENVIGSARCISIHGLCMTIAVSLRLAQVGDIDYLWCI